VNAAERVVETLSALDTAFVFGYPGGRVIEVFEAVAERDGPDTPRLVRPRDEREASVMAEAVGRISGDPAVLAGQGPWIGSLGAIGQMEARLGSTPMLVITEASERGDYSTVAPYQQSRGDYGGLSLPKLLDGVTKEHWFPRTAPETVRSVQLAYKHATAGRAGPCAVVLDGNAVTAEVPEDPLPPLWADRAQTRTWDARPTAADTAAAADLLSAADRPVILAGNGVHAARAHEELERAAAALDAVVVTSYLGKSTIAETHDRAAGVVGAFGHEGANRVVSEADALLVAGCRLNPMDTNWGAPEFVRPEEQAIVHADVDTRNAGWVYPADVGLIGDAAESLAAVAEHVAADADWTGVEDRHGRTHADARERAAAAREEFAAPIPDAADAEPPVDPRRVPEAVEAVVDAETVVTADSGNNRFWLLHYLQTPATRTYFGSGGVGGMGWAPPAAVGAALLGHDAVCVAGDGGFAMTMTAVETAVQQDVAPAFVVMNDTSLGMVRQMGGVPGVEFHDTDFVACAEAMGARGRRVTDPAALRAAVEDAHAANEPTVVDVRVDRSVEMSAELSSSFYDSVGGLHE